MIRAAALAAVALLAGSAVAQPAAGVQPAADARPGSRPAANAPGKVPAELEAAWNASDLGRFGRQFWPEGRHVDVEGGVAEGPAAIAAQHQRLRTGRSRDGRVTAAPPDSRLFGRSHALLRTVITRSDMGPVALGETLPDGAWRNQLMLVVERRGRSWGVLFAQSTRIRPPAPVPPTALPAANPNPALPAAGDPAAAIAELPAAWNASDPLRWGAQFWPESRFVNIGGTVLTGPAAIAAQHARIWSAHYRGTRLALIAPVVTALGPDHTLVTAEATLSGVIRVASGDPPPGGVLPTRFAFVLERRGQAWGILHAQNTRVRLPGDLAPPPAP